MAVVTTSIERYGIYLADLEKCTPFVHAEVYAHRFRSRFQESISRLVAPLL